MKTDEDAFIMDKVESYEIYKDINRSYKLYKVL